MRVFLTDDEMAYNIAEQIKKDFKPGDVMSKGGLRAKYSMPFVKSTCVFRILVQKYGFEEIDIRTLRLPA